MGQQCRGAREQERRTDRYPYLRPGGPRTARPRLHEDHLACSGGAVMAAAKIKKGDSVVVLSGKDKTGTVAKVMPKDGKIVVEGVNIAARHRKPTQQNPQGGIDRFEAPMHLSKVALADPKDGKPTRVRFEEKDGKKVRVAVKSGETIDG